MRLRVGAFGDTGLGDGGQDDDDEWVPVLVDGAPTESAAGQEDDADKQVCPNVVLATEVEVAYALVGAVSNPQVP